MTLTLKDEEQIYLDKLIYKFETMTSILKPEKKEYRKNVLKEVGDYFDLIYTYHDIQMLPDLCASEDDQDVVNCFIKHKELFYLYEDIFRYEPFVIVYSANSENFADITLIFKTMFSHLETYLNFLNKMKSTNQIEEAVNTVKNALKEHVDRNNIRFVIAELIVSEEAYIKKLDTLINDVYPLTNNTKYCLEIKHIVGNSDEIRKNQKLFYEDLLNCVYDSDITEIMDCFLKHEQHFLLYSEDIALKSNSNLINNFKNDFQVPLDIDITVTQTRLMNYKIYLEKAKKISLKCEEKAVVKIEKVEKMVKKILSVANDSMHDIVGANIYIETLGPLKTTGIFKIKPDSASEEYSGEVYLYEKALVFTRGITQRSSNIQTVNYYEGHIITTKLGHIYQEKQKILRVYFQEKLDTKYFYNLMSDDEENLLQMKDAIVQLLWVQVDEATKMLKTS